MDDFIHEDKEPSFDKNKQNKEETSKKNVPKDIEENEAIKNIPKSPSQKNIYEANNLYNPLAKSPAKNISPEKVQIQPEKNIDQRTANHSQSTGLEGEKKNLDWPCKSFLEYSFDWLKLILVHWVVCKIVHSRLGQLLIKFQAQEKKTRVGKYASRIPKMYCMNS